VALDLVRRLDHAQFAEEGRAVEELGIAEDPADALDVEGGGEFELDPDPLAEETGVSDGGAEVLEDGRFVVGLGPVGIAVGGCGGDDLGRRAGAGRVEIEALHPEGMGQDLSIGMETLDVGNARVGGDHGLDAVDGDDDRGRAGAPPHRDRKAGRAEDIAKVLGGDNEEAVELMLLDERTKALLIDHGPDTLFLSFVAGHTPVPSTLP
jgi:hypothetical protein